MAISEAGLDLPEDYVQAGDDHWSEDSGERATATLLGLREPPRAIVAGSEILAVGALRTLRRAGVSVPQDMALVCFDDPRLGDVLDPPMTAIALHAREAGGRAAAVLLRRLQGPHPRVEVRIPAELVVRRSCGCA